ncbi:MAG: pyridoxal-phosphate dependent enzyme [Vicinamibacterales bacterium]
MTRLGLEQDVVDLQAYENSIRRFRQTGIVMPSFGELSDPASIDGHTAAELASVDPDSANPLNLFRIHWHNGADRRSFVPVPGHIVLPASLTGVASPIVVLLGDRFPMIAAHKVLAAYACLAPRIVTGQFDPTRQRAIWPSTGNYCRGGVAISRLMGCRGVAVLPEGMSRERFEWLEKWTSQPDDVIRTPGTESNVKEIYDKCEELEEDPANVVFNQFSEFGNYLAHWAVTGRAVERVVEGARRAGRAWELRAFVSASGSAGTLGAADYLKERCGSRSVVVEPIECPTLLYNGFGEHNIQGIGDKHVPLIHNVMTTDIVVAVSDAATDSLNLLFNTETGREYLLRRRRVPPSIVAQLSSLGLSSICNVLGAIKAAKYCGFGPEDAVATVATDSAAMYVSELAPAARKHFPDGFDLVAAAETMGRYLLGAAIDHVLELSQWDRLRVFNLGYYTWVEQRGVSVEDFDARRKPSFWTGLHDLVPRWDEMIREFNARTGLARPGSGRSTLNADR